MGLLGPRLLMDPALKKILHNDALRDLTGPLLYKVLKDLHAGSSDSAIMDLAKDWKALTCSEATLDDFLAKLDQLIVDSEQQGCARDEESINSVLDELLTKETCKAGWKLKEKIILDYVASGAKRPSGRGMVLRLIECRAVQRIRDPQRFRSADDDSKTDRTGLNMVNVEEAAVHEMQQRRNGMGRGSVAWRGRGRASRRGATSRWTEKHRNSGIEPYRALDQVVTCHRCNGPNHVQQDCTLFPSVDGTLVLTKETLSKLQPKAITCRACNMPNHYADACKQPAGKTQEKFFAKKPDRIQRAKNFFNSARSANINACEAEGAPEEPDSDAWYALEGDQGEEEEEEDDTSIAVIFLDKNVLDAVAPEALPNTESIEEARVALVMTDFECLLDSGAGVSLTPTTMGATKVWEEKTRLILPSGAAFLCTERCTMMETPYIGNEAQQPISVDYVVWGIVPCKIISEKALCSATSDHFQRIILRSHKDVLLCNVSLYGKKITPIMQGYWCQKRGLYYMPVSAQMATKNPRNCYMGHAWNIIQGLSSPLVDDNMRKPKHSQNKHDDATASLHSAASTGKVAGIMGASFQSSSSRMQSDAKTYCQEDEELAKKLQCDMKKEMEVRQEQEQEDLKLAKLLQEQDEEEEKKRGKQEEEDAKVAAAMQQKLSKRRRSEPTPRKAGKRRSGQSKPLNEREERLQEWTANHSEEVIKLVRGSCDECQVTAHEWIQQFGNSKPLNVEQMMKFINSCRTCIGSVGEPGQDAASNEIQQSPVKQGRGQRCLDGEKVQISGKAEGAAGEGSEAWKEADGKFFLDL